MTEKSISNASQRKQTTPGLTLQSLSFQNFSNQIQKKQQKISIKEYTSQNVLIYFLRFDEFMKLNLDYELCVDILVVMEFLII